MLKVLAHTGKLNIPLMAELLDQDEQAVIRSLTDNISFPRSSHRGIRDLRRIPLG